jgi:hypothetical protein
LVSPWQDVHFDLKTADTFANVGASAFAAGFGSGFFASGFVAAVDGGFAGVGCVFGTSAFVGSVASGFSPVGGVVAGFEVVGTVAFAVNFATSGTGVSVRFVGSDRPARNPTPNPITTQTTNATSPMIHPYRAVQAELRSRTVSTELGGMAGFLRSPEMITRRHSPKNGTGTRNACCS